MPGQRKRKCPSSPALKTVGALFSCTIWLTLFGNLSDDHNEGPTVPTLPSTAWPTCKPGWQIAPRGSLNVMHNFSYLRFELLNFRGQFDHFVFIWNRLRLRRFAALARNPNLRFSFLLFIASSFTFFISSSSVIPIVLRKGRRSVTRFLSRRPDSKAFKKDFSTSCVLYSASTRSSLEAKNTRLHASKRRSKNCCAVSFGSWIAVTIDWKRSAAVFSWKKTRKMERNFFNERCCIVNI